MNIPKDPVMLLSFINMKLRDEYAGLDELCAALGLDRKELEEKLEKAGFVWDGQAGRFL